MACHKEPPFTAEQVAWMDQRIAAAFESRDRRNRLTPAQIYRNLGVTPPSPAESAALTAELRASAGLPPVAGSASGHAAPQAGEQTQ